jgi:hypothetical protein
MPDDGSSRSGQGAGDVRGANTSASTGARGAHIIGITGHRRLPAEWLPTLTADIQAFFKAEKEQHVTQPITVLSPLAEGADSLCAKLALDAGLRLVVPLPMSVPEYRRDFSQQAAAEFDRLLALASEAFVVSPQEPIPPQPQRGFFYRQAGIFVAKNCDLLLAIWDGKELNTSDGAGTWETIQLARGFGKPVVMPGGCVR